MVTDIDDALPSYSNPPLVEVACGVRFAPVPGFTVAHIGRLWALYEKEYPITHELPPLLDDVEARLTMYSPAGLFPRIWFEQSNGTYIVQVQRNRFYHNWRKQDGKPVYPRFDSVYRKFVERLDEFRGFLRESLNADLNLTGFELTYVNQLQVGEGWNELADIGPLFAGANYGDPQRRWLKNVEGLNWNSAYRMERGQGQLIVKLRSALRKADRKPVLGLELSAQIAGVPDVPMNTWFETAHQYIVKGFEDITDPKAQRDAWGKQEQA